ncbi:MAG: hypothetical protein R3277_08810 [Brumimicrobium sp.]|nr:hypothetical protein [Brumimicrobium sp.]
MALRQLLVKLNNGFPIIELTVMLYILQYLVAPLFEYNYNPEQSMAVGKEEYLEFTLLAVLAFAVGLFWLKPTFNIKNLTVDNELASKIGRALIIIGFSSQLAMNFLPDALKSTVNFFILFKTIGVYALIFSDNKSDKLLILLFSIQIALSSILGAMLIDFIVFALFFAMFFSLKYQVTNKLKYTFFIIGFLFLSVYQGIKAEYREVVWKEELTTEQKVALLGSLINLESFKSAFSFDVEKNESLIQTMHRLNQGWQTSKVYNHIPEHVPFENGKALANDVISSFMPRFLWEDKREVNDYQRFNYYTGYNLNESTSMSMGVIGDFYLNFGKTGTVIAMFLFGYFIARVKRYFLQNFVYPNPINLIWLPFIFSYLIRPGNEFYMVLNHLFKATVVLIVVFKVIYPWLGVSNQAKTDESFAE